jgi:hypothetical protein
MDTRQQQRGMSLIGMLLLIMIVVGVALLAMRITPMYLDNMAVRGALKGLEADPGARSAESPEQLRSLLQRRLDVNSISTVSGKDIKVRRLDGGGREVRATYQVRVHLVGNLDVVGTFDEAVVVPTGG